MEQSQISIRPNREYTPAPPLALFLARGGLVVVAVVVFVVDVSSPPVLLRRRCRRCSRWSCRLSTSLSLVTVPKVLQNTPLRSVAVPFSSLRSLFSPICSPPSLAIDRSRSIQFLLLFNQVKVHPRAHIFLLLFVSPSLAFETFDIPLAEGSRESELIAWAIAMH